METNNFVITDNGIGISKHRMEESYRNIGKGLAHEKRDIGRYNIGMKIALMKISDSCTIDTKTENESYQVDFNWHKLDDDIPFVNRKLNWHGTTIVVQNPLYKTTDIKQTRDTISKTYKYIIQNGLTIEFNGKTIEAANDIPWIDKQIINGTGYRIEFGTYNGANKGIYKISEINLTTLWFKDRQVSTGLNYDSLSDIGGNYSLQLFVYDGEKYPVNALKDGIIGVEEIINNHAKQIVDFLKRKIEKEQEIKLNDELDKIADDIMRREKRTNGVTHGTVAAEHTDVERTNIKKINGADGKHPSVINRGKIIIKKGFSDGMGHVISGKKITTIMLDDTKPEIDCMFKPKFNREAIYILVCALLHDHNRPTLFNETVSEFMYRKTKGVL